MTEDLRRYKRLCAAALQFCVGSDDEKVRTGSVPPQLLAAAACGKPLAVLWLYPSAASLSPSMSSGTGPVARGFSLCYIPGIFLLLLSLPLSNLFVE